MPCSSCAALTAEIERLKEDIELLELYRRCLFDIDKIWRKRIDRYTACTNEDFRRDDSEDVVG